MLNISASQRKFWVIVATICSLGMVFFDASALPVALPSIQQQLNLSANTLHWVINVYLLVLAVLMLLGGKFSDRFGAKKIFLIGLFIFSASSLTCALAPNGNWLIISRILQGIGGAIMMPTSSPLFRSVVSAQEFGKVTGMYLSLSSVFLILGPSVGGLLVQYLSWRWIFWINLPTAILAGLAIFLVVPRHYFKLVTEKFDWWGFFTMSIVLVSLVFALMQGSVWGWSDPIIISCLLLSLASCLIFVWIERRQPHPYVHFELFRIPRFSRCILLLFIMQAVFVIAIFFALLLQYTRNYTPLQAGMISLAIQIPVVIFANLAGLLLDRHGPKLPAIMGITANLLACLWIAVFINKPSIFWLLPGFILFGFSIPFINLSTITTCISSAVPERRGIASAITHTVRQIGSSLGLAIFSTIIIELSNRQFSQWLSQARLPNNGLSIEDILGQPLHSTTAAWHQAAVNAYSHGFSYALLLAAGLCGLALVISWRLPKAEGR